MTTHQCPSVGEYVMPCCGLSPFETDPFDRITEDKNLVTCVDGLTVIGRDHLDFREFRSGESRQQFGWRLTHESFGPIMNGLAIRAGVSIPKRIQRSVTLTYGEWEDVES